jgi:hypothetical protein
MPRSVPKPGAGEGLAGGAEGLLSAAVEHPEAAAQVLGAAAAAQGLNPSELLGQARDIHSADDALAAASNVASKLAGTAAGQQALEQAAKAKALYDQQTTGRITKIADNAMRGAQAKITERAQGPGGGLLLGVAGTIGGIADQAAGPSAAVALSDEVPGSRPKASRNPPALPTKLQLATMIANEEATDRDAVRNTHPFLSHFKY